MRFKLLRLSPHFWFHTQEDSHLARSPPDPDLHLPPPSPPSSRRPSFILRRSTSLKLVKSSPSAAPAPAPDHNCPHLPPTAAPRPANVRRVCTVVDAGCACRATVTSSTRRQEAQEMKRERSPATAPTARPLCTSNKSPSDVGGGERPKPATDASKEAALLEWKVQRDIMKADEFLAMAEDKNSCRRKGRKKAESGGAIARNDDRDLVVLERDERGTECGWPPRMSSSSSSGGGASNHDKEKKKKKKKKKSESQNRGLIMMAEDGGGGGGGGAGGSCRPGRDLDEEENEEGGSGGCREVLWRHAQWAAAAKQRSSCSVDAEEEEEEEAWRPIIVSTSREGAAGEMAAERRRRSMSFAEGEERRDGGPEIEVIIGRRRRRRKGGGAVAMAMAKRSVDPRADFKKSMEEMVAAKGIGGQAHQLHDLLHCYLSLNPRRYHSAIVSAFHDLLLASSHPHPPPPYSAASSSSVLPSSLLL